MNHRQEPYIPLRQGSRVVQLKDTIETGKSGASNVSDDSGSVYSVTRSYNRKLKKMDARSQGKVSPSKKATIMSPSVKDLADDVTNEVIYEEPESPVEDGRAAAPDQSSSQVVDDVHHVAPSSSND